jgi:hypothetical protein
MALVCQVCAKSARDHIGVFPCQPKPPVGGTGVVRPDDHQLVVVSSCPSCGAPVYGKQKVSVSVGDVLVKYSCDCRKGNKSIMETMRTT